MCLTNLDRRRLKKSLQKEEIHKHAIETDKDYSATMEFDQVMSHCIQFFHIYLSEISIKIHIGSERSCVLYCYWCHFEVRKQNNDSAYNQVPQLVVRGKGRRLKKIVDDNW
ncbi:hypothetical protein L6452_26697 [Arctium lappa]|uniref:Uncharacterized protein n=1 Tax=Arctium lappa TaxID=4217 RepID=A0ACB8ZVL4_ARCLA|nr:hypothetical protein L6452_26697 [Arctium lappa]